MALRFFFKVTVIAPDFRSQLSKLHDPRKVPVVLSPDEVPLFLGGTGRQIQGGGQRGRAFARLLH